MTTDQPQDTVAEPIAADAAMPETDLPPCFAEATGAAAVSGESTLIVALSPMSVELASEPQPAAEAESAITAAPSTEAIQDDQEQQDETGSYPVFVSEKAAPAEVTTSSETVIRAPRTIRGGWTFGLMCIGLGIIACCVLLPAGDETRKLMYERETLRTDLEHIEAQVATNEEFLKKVETDPTLAERLAQRQMKLLPAGTAVLDVDASPTETDSSPYLLVSVPAAKQLPPYQPRGGTIASLFRPGRSQLYLLGAGLMLCATGLVLGSSRASD